MNSKEYVNYIIELLSPFGSITARAMFGGHSIYKNSVIIGLIIDDELYFKTNLTTEKNYEKYDSEPFTYDGKDKKVKMPYWKVPIEIMEDQDLLQIWLDKAYEVSINSKKK
ncbi:MAG: TfoX/Sxy family protein [Sphingobacteriia bacterium]|nr:TfoX/Sxy family protein [Sphingobacteriia bacterium]